MAIQLADTLAPMADYPLAMSEDIQFTDGSTLESHFESIANAKDKLILPLDVSASVTSISDLGNANITTIPNWANLGGNPSELIAKKILPILKVITADTVNTEVLLMPSVIRDNLWVFSNTFPIQTTTDSTYQSDVFTITCIFKSNAGIAQVAPKFQVSTVTVDVAGKQDKLIGGESQYVGFDSNGNAKAVDHLWFGASLPAVATSESFTENDSRTFTVDDQGNIVSDTSFRLAFDKNTCEPCLNFGSVYSLEWQVARYVHYIALERNPENGGLLLIALGGGDTNPSSPVKGITGMVIKIENGVQTILRQYYDTSLSGIQYLFKAGDKIRAKRNEDSSVTFYRTNNANGTYSEWFTTDIKDIFPEKVLGFICGFTSQEFIAPFATDDMKVANKVHVQQTFNPDIEFLRDGLNQTQLDITDTVGDLSDLTTTDKTNIVAAINEINANGSGSAGTSSDFTYVVDSNDALLAWANNTAGNDYTNVLIKKGTWTLTKKLNLSDKTKTVVGEVGSKLVFDGSAGILYNTDESSTDRWMRNVHVECINTTDERRGFQYCINLTDCSVKMIGTKTVIGFYYCDNLAGCHAFCETTPVQLNNAIGFQHCNYLTRCESVAEGLNLGVGFGYSYCDYLTNCKGSGTGSVNAFAFNYCNYLTNCEGEATGRQSDSKTAATTATRYCNYLVNHKSVSTVDAGSAFGYRFCEGLTNCIGTGTGTTGVVFKECKGLSRCRKHETSTTGVFSQSYASFSENATYACADTPEGGFNDPTN